MGEPNVAALAALLNKKEGWDCLPGDMLKGCIAMYRATGEEHYRTAVFLYLYARVTPLGDIFQGHSSPYCEGFGTALLFSLDETGDERFRIAAEALFNQYSSPNRPLKPFLSESENADQSVFLTAYDTRFGKRQTYKEIVRRFSSAHELYFQADEGIYRFPKTRSLMEGTFSGDGILLSALADTLENMDRQLYEHYRALEDQFLNAVHGLMRYQDRSGVLRSVVDAWDEIATAKILYALHKGIRLGLLDEEKYLPVVTQTYTLWREEMYSRTVWLGIEGACMMANGEMKMGEEKRE